MQGRPWPHSALAIPLSTMGSRPDACDEAGQQMAVPKKQPTETISVAEARENFSDVVTRPLRGEGRVIVEQAGTPIGAIVSMDDVRRLEQLDREWDEFEDVLRRTQSGFEGIPPDEIEQEIDRAIAEVEADYRAGRDAEPGSGA